MNEITVRALALYYNFFWRPIEQTEWLLTSSSAYDVIAYHQTQRYWVYNPPIDQSMTANPAQILIDLEVYLAAFILPKESILKILS